MQTLSLKKICIFIAAAETDSFTEAARQSNISQPAVVSIVDEIEAISGEELFVRHGKVRCAKLTPRGKETYDALVQAKTFYDQALRSISKAKKTRCEHGVLIQAPYASAVSPDWLWRLISGYTEGGVSIRVTDWHQILATIEKHDRCVALIDGEVCPRNREYLPLGSYEMVLVTSNPSVLGSADNNVISWTDVPKYTFIYSGINPTTKDRIYQTLKIATDASKDHFIEVNSRSILQQFLIQFKGTAIIPTIVSNSLQMCDHQLRSLQFSHSRIYVPLGLVMPFGHCARLKMKHSDLQQAFDRMYVP
ncbi:DNA-binding transcriptional LysR family regulator [Bradyrhizobium sp. USDA 4524]|uniref:LysR family transcriptional regulator n=1 Tax=unclassified Bradyrhizobium TaxID=2631580 RepID=UPI00209DC47E|nr:MULTISPECIES: LysR family transcriptional regulator [unclassified Bradyrhizobium]MCP1846105.1 DNA-binding transcriptional LysR family regulator [Bradyrhizobium sp. USDA 4538]MCP1907261.1 DNA-binding transcriptional LysR family regulator [Bradyrhizobium sp. USDA 4537]MCP1985736.1 DNA-binding transcriptional LysR family regulator [Bradyrhizobium sp. USDA 4539]